MKGNKMSALPAEWVNGWPGSANSSLVNVRLSFKQFQRAVPCGAGRGAGAHLPGHQQQHVQVRFAAHVRV